MKSLLAYITKEGLLIAATVIALAITIIGLPAGLIGAHHLYGNSQNTPMLIVSYIIVIVFVIVMARILKALGQKLDQ